MADVARRPRLLFLSQVLPYPPDSGVAIRTYHVLRILSLTFDVTALCFFRARAHGTGMPVEQSVARLREFAEVEAFAIPQEHSRARLIMDHARSLLTRTAYTNYAYRSADFSARLTALLSSEKFDVIHVDSLDLADYLPLLAGQRVVCVHHNVESRLMHRRADGEANPATRWYLRRQAGWIAAEENRWCPRVSLNIAVSEQDRADFIEAVGPARFVVVPNGVDVAEFMPGGDTENIITYIGGTEWFPNVDALNYLCSSMLPAIRAGIPDVKVQWIGRASQDEVDRYRASCDVDLTGYVPDIRPILARAACVVVPLRIGGGTRLKITTAWAMGKAIVSTSIGCEGLEAVDGENILIRDTPADFAEAVILLLRDAALRARLEAGARVTAETLYDWSVIGSAMTDAYVRLLGAEPASQLPSMAERE